MLYINFVLKALMTGKVQSIHFKNWWIVLCRLSNQKKKKKKTLMDGVGVPRS